MTKTTLTWNYFSRIFLGMIAACMLVFIAALIEIPGWLAALIIGMIAFAAIIVFGIDAVIKVREERNKTLTAYRAAISEPESENESILGDYTEQELAAIMKYKTNQLLGLKNKKSVTEESAE